MKTTTLRDNLKIVRNICSIERNLEDKQLSEASSKHTILTNKNISTGQNSFCIFVTATLSDALLKPVIQTAVQN